MLAIVASLGRHPGNLERALGSLLEQRPEPVDAVVVLPAGAAVARDAAGRRGVRVLDDPGRGLAAAVNAGLSVAAVSHRYVTWLGDADVLLPGAVATASAVLDRDPEAVVAYGDCRYLTPEGEYLLTSNAGGTVRQFVGLGLGRPTPPAALFRLDAVTAVGRLDETLVYATDLDLLLRLHRRGRFAATGRTLAVSRWDTPTPTPVQRSTALAETRQVLRRHLPAASVGLLALAQPPGSLGARLAGRRIPPGVLRAAAWSLPRPPTAERAAQRVGEEPAALVPVPGPVPVPSPEMGAATAVVAERVASPSPGDRSAVD
ncbi:MAG TPA: glycosyltransferase family A protein [Kineosporiaceae bacterium]